MTNPDKYNRGGAISDAPQVRGGAICDALQVRSGAIVDAPFVEPEKCCIKNCYIVVSLNKVLIILMLGRPFHNTSNQAIDEICYIYTHKN